MAAAELKVITRPYGELVNLILNEFENCKPNSPPATSDETSRLSRLLEDVHSLEQVEELREAANLALDTIETQINDEVNERSEAFFSACSSLKRLMDTIGSIHQASVSIHGVVHEMERNRTELKVKLGEIQQQHESLLEAKRKLQLIHEFVSSQELIQSLLETHAFVDALRVVEQKIVFLKEELSGIDTMAPMLVELEEMKMALTKMLSNTSE